MKDIIINQKKIHHDIHLKNIFVRDVYLELGIIDYEVVQKLLKFEIVNINDLTFFPVQNRGVGHSSHKDQGLKNSLPYLFFYNLACNHTHYTLCLSYGLLKYFSVDNRESFMPVIIMPIKMYYEENELFIQLLYKPVLNPLIYSIIHTSKLSFTQGLNYLDIKALDYTLSTLSKIPKITVSPDNFLTYYELKEKDIFISKNIQGSKRKGVKNNLFFDNLLNSDQIKFIQRAMNFENLTLIGFSGCGKTTALKNLLVNNLANNIKTLFISESKETINEVYKFLESFDLNNLVCNMTFSFPKMTTFTPNKKKLFDDVNIYEVRREFSKNLEMLNSLEKEINKLYNGFKVTELIEEYFLMDSTINDFKDLDNVDDVYKHEYFEICKVLKNLENYYKKIDSFKNSVWNAIPIFNKIKHVNQIINLVIQLNQGFKKLRNFEDKLNDIGVINIQSFSEMKKYITSFERMDTIEIPKAWKTSIEIFEKVKDAYSDLKKELNIFLNINIHKDYINISDVDIEKEIENHFGSYYQNNEDLINILKNKNEVLDKINFFEENFNTFETILKIISKNYNLDTEKIIDVYNFRKNFKYNNKILRIEKEEVSSLINLEKDIKKLYYDLKQTKIYQKQKRKLILLELDKLKKDYTNLSDFDYQTHHFNIEIISNFNSLITKYKSDKLNLTDFLSDLIDNSQLNKKLDSFNYSFNNLNSIFEYFKNFKISFLDLSFFSKVTKYNSYINYVKKLINSNELVNSKKVNKTDFLNPEELYRIKEENEKYNYYLDYFKKKKLYKDLFDFLYEEGETNLNQLTKVIQVYDAYIQAFVSFEDVYQSFNNYELFLDLRNDISNLLKDLGENLRLYSLIFKDSVSRYYFSNIENNIYYLTNLVGSKDELVAYLGITQNLSILKNYKFSNLIAFVSENDSIAGITNSFKNIYLNNLLTKFYNNNPFLINIKDYLKLLNNTLKEEDEINSYNKLKILNSIKIGNEFNIHNKKYKNYKYTTYFKDNKNIGIYLTFKDLALNYYKDIKYDTVIIDDAHTITSGEYNNLFKGKQVIISGDYQNNKVVNQNLVSLAPNKETIVLKKRYEKAPKGLTKFIIQTKSPYLDNLEQNLGAKVIENNLENYIYNLYIQNEDIKINYFIKNVTMQKEVYERFASVFYDNKVSASKITSFLTTNLFVVCLYDRIYNKSDINILYLKDYWDEDSQIAASNIIDILVLAKKELIIYDTENILLKDAKHEFFKKVKSIVNNNTIFEIEPLNLISLKIKEELEKKGFEVFFPGNNINFSFLKKGSNILYAVYIFYSNSITSDIYNIYKDLKKQYDKIIFRFIFDLYEGINIFVDKLIGEVNG